MGRGRRGGGVLRVGEGGVGGGNKGPRGAVLGSGGGGEGVYSFHALL